MQKLEFLTSNLTRIARQSLDIVFPITCPGCQKTIDSTENKGIFCSNCRMAQTDPPVITCFRCGALIPDTDLILADGCYCCIRSDAQLTGVVTLGSYHEDEQLGRMILAMKHGGKTWYCREFGYRLAKRIHTLFPDGSWDAVVAVPLHRYRKWKRGYNQAALIAKSLAENLGIDSYEWLLRRHRRTRPQSGGRSERSSNVEGAFAAGGICTNARIILVDDVVTTGATSRECAMTLSNAGAREILLAACAWVPIQMRRK